MIHHGLFSSLFLKMMQESVACPDDAQGRLLTLRQNWQRQTEKSGEDIWASFLQATLGNLGFVVNVQNGGPGLHFLYEDFSLQDRIAALYLVEPGADLDDLTVGRFWPAKLNTALCAHKLNWGILTDGARWRLYSTKAAKPLEDYVELNLADTLVTGDEVAYGLFERFFHVDSFQPLDREDYESEKIKRLKNAGIKARKTKAADDEASDNEQAENDEQERRAGIYRCRLDLDSEISEAILEDRVKQPLVGQVDNVLRYICNGFIADTPRSGDTYTEEERRAVFESSVKLLYRCLFLFYAEARKLLPSEDKSIEAYAPHSMHALCCEARKFRWNERTDNSGYDLWQQFKGLIQAVNEGDPTYGVMAYNGGLFDDQEEFFLGQHRLRNDYFWPALYGLAFVEPGDAGAEAEYAIPYGDLEVRHLGEMYEAILEYKVRLADTDYLRRQTKNGWQTLPAAGQKPQAGDIRIRAGDIFFGETALERKQSGSYYTPESLVRFLVKKAVIAPLRERWDTTCEPRFAAYVAETRDGFDEAARRGGVRAAEELVRDFVRGEVLTYKVCDPAMGSGHFLVATANLMGDFVAGLLARIEAVPGVGSTTHGAPNHWRRLITRHCLYGVDLNPLAVNLAKLALWLNSFARDHKLTFLDHHLRCGNSLIGIRDLASLQRIPMRRKQTKKATEETQDAQELLPLGLDDNLNEQLAMAANTISAIVEIAEDDTDRQRTTFADTSAALHAAFDPLADLHTGYLMDGKVTPEEYARLLTHFLGGNAESELSWDLQEPWQRIARLRQRHDFFHWPLEFPDVFDGETAGFSATVGNPPWDAVKPNSQEFYSQWDLNFRSYGKQEALKVVKKLHENLAVAEAWEDYEKGFKEQSSYFTEPLAIPALGKGDVNTYKLFLNLSYLVLRRDGNMGILVPSGLYTDEGCLPLRKLFFENTRIESLYCFENRWPVVFPAVHNSFKFITFSTRKGGETEGFKCAFMQHDPERLAVIEAGAAVVNLEQVAQFSPHSLSLMEFPSQESVNIASKAYGNWPLLGERMEGVWNAKLANEFHMTGDSRLFNQAGDGYPLYEGKLINIFDHQHSPPNNWMNAKVARREEENSYWRILKKRKKPSPKVLDHELYRIGHRSVAASTNERTLVTTVIPAKVACPHSMILVRRLIPDEESGEPVEQITSGQTTFLAALLSSIICDFLLRMKVTTNITMPFVYSLPIPRLGCGDARDATYFWPIVLRALRLICTTEDYADLWAEVFPQIPADTLAAAAQTPPAYGPAHEQTLRERMAASYKTLDATWSPDCAFHDRRPDRRDDGDRAQTRAEIDALVAHLYGLTSDEFAYILDTFPGLRRKELAAFGEFQSKRKALEEYERLATTLPR